MKQFLSKFAVSVATMGMSALAYAQVRDDSVSIPEPGVLGLAAIGAVVAIAVSISKNGRK